jgi:hypothetical protein
MKAKTTTTNKGHTMNATTETAITGICEQVMRGTISILGWTEACDAHITIATTTMRKHIKGLITGDMHTDIHDAVLSGSLSSQWAIVALCTDIADDIAAVITEDAAEEMHIVTR